MLHDYNNVVALSYVARMAFARTTLYSVLVIAAAACGKSSKEPSDRPAARDGSGSSVSTGSGAGSSARAPAPAGYDADALGSLHFDVSGGTPAARAAFDRGLLALHSFWYDEATKQFSSAIMIDRSFAMAYWGLAMSQAKLLWGEDDIGAGKEALQHMPSPQTLPPHDQAWVVAATTLFRRSSPDVRAARRGFLAIMEKLHAKFPSDESATFLALALLSTLQPGDPNEDQLRKRAAELATEVYKRNPKHPGASHYLLHAYDTPQLASLGLPAAKLYATIAPAAFHALHMPSHIFVRLGMWKDAVASNQQAWDASVAWVARDKLSIDHQDFHSLSWLIELDFERGRYKDAERDLGRYAAAIRAGVARDKRAAYANQVASFVARTNGWARIDELLAPLQAAAVEPPSGPTAPTPPPTTCGSRAPVAGSPGELFEQRAVLAARAQAAALQRDPVKVGKLLDQRDAVDAALRPFLAASQPKELIEAVDRLRGFVRKSLIARATGNDRALIEALKPLAIDQKDEFIGEGVAGGVLHDEAIADAMLRLGQAKPALEAYRGVLAQHAGRARSLLGAARAASKAGDDAAARDYYQQLATIWSEADDGIEGLAEAKQALATR